MKIRKAISELLIAAMLIGTIPLNSLAEGETVYFDNVGAGMYTGGDEWGEAVDLASDSVQKQEEIPEGVNLSADAPEEMAPAADVPAEEAAVEAEIMAAEAVEDGIARENMISAEDWTTSDNLAEDPASSERINAVSILREGEENPATRVHDGVTVTWGGGETQNFDDLQEAVDFAGEKAESTVRLNADIDLGNTSVKIVCTPSELNGRMTFDLNGYMVQSSNSSNTINAYQGTFVFCDTNYEQKSETERKIKPEKGIVNTGGGYALNSGEHCNELRIISGLYEANTNAAICAWQGNIIIPAGNVFPFVYTRTGDNPVMIESAKVSICSGIFNKKPNGVSKEEGKQAYEAYYYKNEGYYVVMEKHPIYMRVTNGEGQHVDKGYDTIADALKDVPVHTTPFQPDDERPQVDTEVSGGSEMSSGTQGSNGTNYVVPTVMYLLEDYTAGSGDAAVNIVDGKCVVFDLHGCKLKGLTKITISNSEGKAYLEIADSISGGQIEAPTQLSDQDRYNPNIKISGGTYLVLGHKEGHTDDKGYLTLLGWLKKGYFLNETVDDGIPYLTVLHDTASVLVRKSGQSGGSGFATVAEAMEAADEGDVLELLHSINMENESLDIYKAIVLDLKGYSITSRAQYAVFISVDGARITNSSNQSSIIQVSGYSARTIYGVYVENVNAEAGGATHKASDLVFQIDNVTIQVQNNQQVKVKYSGIEITLPGNCCCLATDHPCTANAENCVFRQIGGNGSVISVDKNSVATVTGSKTMLTNINEETGDPLGSKLEIGTNGQLTIECADQGRGDGLTGKASEFSAANEGLLILNDGKFACQMSIESGSTGNVYINGGMFGPQDSKTSFFGESCEENKANIYVSGGNFDSVSTPLTYLAAGCFLVSGTGGYSYSASIGAAIKNHGVVFGDGLYLKIGVMKNPNLKQRVKDEDYRIKVTWLAHDGVARESKYYDITNAEPEKEIDPSWPEGSRVKAYYVKVPFSPKNMTDEVIIEAEAKNTEEGVQYPRWGDFGIMIPEQVDTTVRSFTQKRYNALPGKNTQTDVMATMLMYGAEAQKYADYKKGDPADKVEWLTDELKDDYTEVPSEEPGGVKFTGEMFKAHSIDLGAAYAVKLYIDKVKISDDENYCVVAKHAGKTEYSPKITKDGKPGWSIVTIDPETENEKEYYVATIPGIMYTNCPVTYNAVMQVGAFEDGTWTGIDVEGEKAVFSVNQCLYDYYNKHENVDLVTSAYRFGIYARKFVEK